MKILYWSPLPIWPARSGSQVRMASVIEAMVENGHEVHLMAPARTRRMSWEGSASEVAASRGLATAQFWDPTPADFVRAHLLHPLLRRFAPDLEPFLRLLAPRRLKEDVEALASFHRIDLAFLNYSFSSALVDASAVFATACDILDLQVANYRMQSVGKVRRIDFSRPPRGQQPAAHSSDLTSWGGRMEIARLGVFDGLISISVRDREILLGSSPGRQSTLLPVCFAEVEEARSPGAQAPAGMFLGDNPHNLEGLAWFLKSALPELRRRIPGFRLLLGGSICGRLAGEAPGVELIGRVGSAASFYRRVGLVICPTFTGTGEQIKIGEAMSHARATVSFDWMSSPVVHGLDGVRAASGSDFLEATADLAMDPARCESLGASARVGIQARRGVSRFRTDLERFLEETRDSHLRRRAGS